MAGRWITFLWNGAGSSVKHEDVYLRGYATMPELLIGLTEYFVLYNTERPHQSLGYATPDQVYRTASGGVAKDCGQIQ